MMAENRGGYRAPSNPSPVGLPGALSKRTDGGPTQAPRYISGGAYGDGQELMTVQQSAPLAAAGTPQTQGQWAAPAPSATPPTPLGAPTERPNEPVTEGNPLGPGSGPGVLSGGLGTNRDAAAQDARALKPYLPALIEAANMPDVPQSFVRFVHYLRNI